MELGKRALIIGKSGSGKSMLAMQLLLDTVRENPEIGVLIVNHKNEKDLNRILPPCKKIPSRFRIGDRINIVPLLGDKDDDLAVNKLLLDIYHNAERKGHKGTIVLIDEGLMINPRNKEMLALQTQGRSKDISVITLSQRPKYISLFTVTQASYVYIFNVMGTQDVKTLEEVIRPKGHKLEDVIDSLEEFHYVAYDEKKKAGDIEIMPPVKFPVKGKIEPIKKPIKKPLIIAGTLAALIGIFKAIN
jgi:DNA helicase HerA-like ATPase